jgi:hypothetical protein
MGNGKINFVKKWGHRQDADCKPGSVAKNHLSGRGIAAAVQQLTQGLRPGKPRTPSVKPCSGWGLSQSRPSPAGTVSSCLTFSPLPGRTNAAGRSVLCDTVLSPRATRGNPCWGSSFPAEPGLSSPFTQERGDSSSASC